MNAGELKRRITIQQKETIKDEEGTVLPSSWTDVATVWADPESIKGREYFQAAAINERDYMRFRIRYRKGIKSLTMRVKYDNRNFLIEQVSDVKGQHKELQLLCQEVLGEQFSN